jgi:hypothetical protein
MEDLDDPNPQQPVEINIFGDDDGSNLESDQMLIDIPMGEEEAASSPKKSDASVKMCPPQ